MLLGWVDVVEGRHLVWHCMGCGQEIHADPANQAEDERLVQLIRSQQGKAPGRQ
jgi:hypothetical protein